jgi:hypothetical protein
MKKKKRKKVINIIELLKENYFKNYIDRGLLPSGLNTEKSISKGIVNNFIFHIKRALK